MANSCPAYAAPGGDNDTSFSGSGYNKIKVKKTGRLPALHTYTDRHYNYFSYGIRFIFFLCLALFPGSASAAHLPSCTFWYGPHPPADLLSQFDRIVVEADNLSDEQIKILQQHGGKVIAYLSIGESNPLRSTQDPIRSDWVIDSNAQWNSRIMDLTAGGWQQSLQNRAAVLKKRGFNGLFLDTLDSHMLPAMSAEKRKEQQQGLVKIIRSLKAGHPDYTLMANRGFEVMDRIAPYLDAVAAESLYHGWNNAGQQYQPVAQKDRLWLTKTLRAIQSRHKLDIVIVDYLPPQQRKKARAAARKIERHGFIPWIANPSFDYMGIGAIEAIPRKVLMLYDGRGEHHDFSHTRLHRLCAAVFEHMGYLPVYIDISQGLPQEILKGRYIGIVTWLVTPLAQKTFQRWLAQKIEETIPVALLGNLTFLKDKDLKSLLGLSLGRKLDAARSKIIAQSDLIGFKADGLGRIDHVLPITALEQKHNKSHLRIQDNDGHQADLIVTGDWGGLAGSSALLDQDFAYSSRWNIDPSAFFKMALKLPPIPVPDITTENGRRLFFIHIDGDGFTEKFETPGRGYAAQILLQKIFKVYPVPHTISIIEGEIGPEGIYPEISPQLESIAREIFALKHVEIASHSYSHPFQWTGDFSENQASGYHLPIKGYTFDPEREILGSVRYIDSRLAPPGKKTTVFLWTGNGLPTPEALAIANRIGLLNMNGGDAPVRKAWPLPSGTFGIGRPFSNGAYQTYAPVGNENSYTNNWEGPFVGYRRVVETLQLTDSPVRLKPISIYYHFYSGSKHASLKALKTVYDWAMTRETMPIHAGEYIRKTLNFQDIGIARRSDGSFRITGLKTLKTLRLAPESGWPQEGKTQGIAGWRRLAGGIYLHGGHGSVAEFTLGSSPNHSIRLHQANGRTLKWQIRADGGIDFRIQANVPVMMEVANAAGNCRVKWNGGVLTPFDDNDNFSTFIFPVNDTGDAELNCHG